MYLAYAYISKRYIPRLAPIRSFSCRILVLVSGSSEENPAEFTPGAAVLVIKILINARVRQASSNELSRRHNTHKRI